MENRDTLSILEKIESGEKTVEDAEEELAKALEESMNKTPQSSKAAQLDSEEASTETQVEADEIMSDTQPGTAEPEAYMPSEATETEITSLLARPKSEIVEGSEKISVTTRRERKLALARRVKNMQSNMMVGMESEGDGLFKWPWPDSGWQWMWQNLGHPTYINHSIDVIDGSELNIVSYHGDLFIRGWDEPMLKLNGAALDVRTGQDKGMIRLASSTGQMHIWLPKSITRLSVRTEPGDVWISNISADIEVDCISGDLNCERAKGSNKIQVSGGDTRLTGIEGSIEASVVCGNIDARDILSDDVSLNTKEGNIWLSLDSVKSGKFLCESTRGDINLLNTGDLSCELEVETTDSGMISPTMLPWQRLMERSEGRIHGIIAGGEAYIGLLAHDGKIYIQESPMGEFSMPSVS